MSALARLKRWARAMKRDVHALYLCARDPRVPAHAKVFAALVAGYALSPIDLIPDFIPILGYLDDLALVPIGIWAALKLIPPDILAEHRRAASVAEAAPSNRAAAAIIVTVWLVCAVALTWLAWRLLQ